MQMYTDKLQKIVALTLLALSAIQVSAAPAQPKAEYREHIPYLAATISSDTTSLKGLAIKVGTTNEPAAICFDTELLRVSAGWTGGFVQGVNMMSRGQYPTNIGKIVFSSDAIPGWVVDGKFGDPRKDPHGPLPKSVAHYRGLYLNESVPVMAYTVANAEVLEQVKSTDSLFTRTLEVSAHTVPFHVLVARVKEKPSITQAETMKLAESGFDVWCDGLGVATKWEVRDGHLYLVLPAAKNTQNVSVSIGKIEQRVAVKAVTSLKPLTQGGPARWPQTVTVKGLSGLNNSAYTVDTIPVPFENSYQADMLLAGVDFFSDGRAAVCTFHGDVWIVSGLDDKLQNVTWKRYAAGMYHALGLKIVNDTVYVLGRDQITRLHDLNKDGEADFYENFNNDMLITKNFHEFALDLHTDAKGNFYFAKAGPVNNGGRGFMEILPHHGTLMRVSKDGSKLDVVATGLRAPNGIGVGPNGEITSGDNEGTWTPRCRLNWIKEGGFYGVVDLAHKTPLPTDYDRPLCWFPKEVDNSSGGQVWVTSDKWGPLKGELLHTAYGTCSLYLVLKEEVNGLMQGGVVKLPLSFESGIMRARFSPKDGQLYLVGMKGWQTSAGKNGCFQRVRYTGKPLNLPRQLHAVKGGLVMEFSDALDKELANDLENYSLRQWNYVWSASYGSPEVSARSSTALKPGDKGGTEWTKEQMMIKEHDTLVIKSAKLSADGKTVFLEIPELHPAMQVHLRYNLETAEGAVLRQEIFHTIHHLGAARN
ncbi:MAG TPA: DUF6797 domain-containing protein [Verrucomicrobiae bacterium]